MYSGGIIIAHYLTSFCLTSLSLLGLVLLDNPYLERSCLLIYSVSQGACFHQIWKVGLLPILPYLPLS